LSNFSSRYLAPPACANPPSMRKSRGHLQHRPHPHLVPYPAVAAMTPPPSNSHPSHQAVVRRAPPLHQPIHRAPGTYLDTKTLGLALGVDGEDRPLPLRRCAYLRALLSSQKAEKHSSAMARGCCGLEAEGALGGPTHALQALLPSLLAPPVGVGLVALLNPFPNDSTGSMRVNSSPALTLVLVLHHKSSFPLQISSSRAK
jgi:hypothetical protein